MTKEEHKLMILLFAKQMQFLKTLLNMLKSRGLISDDDPRFFEYATALDAESNAALYADALAAYVKAAKGLGIETGLETP